MHHLKFGIKFTRAIYIYIYIYIYMYKKRQWVGVVVTVYICSKEVFDLNSCRDSGCPDYGFSWVSSVPPENTEIFPGLGHYRLLLDPFHFIIHAPSYHSNYIVQILTA
jgi:hypothetical protein